MSIELMHGDCLVRMAEIPDGSVDMILADLPYGTTACKWDNVIPFEPLWKHYWRVLKPNGAAVLFGKEPFSSHLRMSQINRFKYDWFWQKDSKSNFFQAGFQPLNSIESISVFSRAYARKIKGKTSMCYFPQFSVGEAYNLPKTSKTTAIFKENHRNGKFEHRQRDTRLRYPYNFLKFNSDKTRLHPTQKPVALLEYLIKTYTLEGETVLDNTMGSGSTGVACVNTGRKFIGIEQDDKYFAIAQQRIAEANQ